MPVSKEIFKSLVQAAAESILIVDTHGRIVWHNDQLQMLFGYAADELLGQPVEILVPAELREHHAEQRQGFFSLPRHRPMGEKQSLRGQRKDGQTFPLEVSLSFAGSGDEMRVMAMIQDVSARRQMETSLRRSEGRYRAMTDDVLDSSAVGTLVFDAENRVVWFNRAFGAFFSLHRQAWPGRSRSELLREGIAPRLSDLRQLAPLEQLAASASPTHFECHLAADDNLPELWLDCHSQPIVNGLYRGGRIDHFYDITLIKQLEEAREAQFQDHIRELEREIDQMSRLVKPETIPVTSELMGVEPLQRHLPEVFNELVDEYAELLGQALENRVVETGVDVSGRLSRLGENLGFLRGTPRDLIDVHRCVLAAYQSSERPERLRGLIAEGQLLLIELMGNLALFYRRKAVLLQPNDALPTTKAGELHGN